MCIIEACQERTLMPTIDPQWTRSIWMCMQTQTHVHAHKAVYSLGLFTQVYMLWTWCSYIVAVVGLCSVKFSLSLLLLCFFSFNPITFCQVSYSYHLDKRPRGKSCQMSVFDWWDLCVRLVYISFIPHMSSFSLSECHIHTPLRTNLMCLFEDSWRTNWCCYQHVAFVYLCERACMPLCVRGRMEMHTWVFVDTRYPDEISNRRNFKDRDNFCLLNSQ